MDAATRARLVGLFFAEAEEAFPNLEALAERLAIAGDAEALVEFGRVAHGLKGAAAAVGLPVLSEVMHGLEQLALDMDAEDPMARADQHRRLNRLLQAIAATVAEAQSARETELSPGAMARLKKLLQNPDERGTDPNLPRLPLEEKVKTSGSGIASPPPRRGATGSHAAIETGDRPATHSRTMASAQSSIALDRLSLPAEEVDQALALASSLARASSALEDEVVALEPRWAPALQDVVLQSEKLEALLFDLRLIPAGEALAGLETEVTQLAARLSKKASLSVQGDEVRADRRTLTAARGLLRHLIRNSLDHGLESTEERVRAGKPEEGRLVVVISMSENRLHVRVQDDGKGFDVAAIRKKLATEAPEMELEFRALSDQDVIQRFAEWGGSTRAAATEVSGRGVGLSAVASMARSRGGDFVVRSTPGQGSLVSFSLPLEVFATDVLTLQVGLRTFGLPLASVEQTIFLGPQGLGVQRSPTGMTLAVGERIIPLYRMASVVNVEADAGAKFAVVVRTDGREAAFSVDELGITTRVVPRAVPPVIGPDSLATGVALLADGTLLQVLSPRRLLDLGRTAPTRTREAASTTRRVLDVVLAEDSPATREVLRVLLEERGCRVRVAGDGEEALQKIRQKVPDVVVTDLNMPRRDGISLCKALRAAAETARLPVVLLTSQDDDASRASGAAAGADAYLIKSKFNEKVLRETLVRLGFEA